MINFAAKQGNIEVMTDITQIQEQEYDAILRQAVAVIDRTRAMVATARRSAKYSLPIFFFRDEAIP